MQTDLTHEIDILQIRVFSIGPVKIQKMRCPTLRQRPSSCLMQPYERPQLASERCTRRRNESEPASSRHSELAECRRRDFSHSLQIGTLDSAPQLDARYVGDRRWVASHRTRREVLARVRGNCVQQRHQIQSLCQKPLISRRVSSTDAV